MAKRNNHKFKTWLMEINAMNLSQEKLKSKAVMFCEDFGEVDKKSRKVSNQVKKKTSNENEDGAYFIIIGQTLGRRGHWPLSSPSVLSPSSLDFLSRVSLSSSLATSSI